MLFNLRTQYGHDESPHSVKNVPECVAFPKSTADITKIAKWCHQNNICMIPYGTGSGLEAWGLTKNHNFYFKMFS